jgi:dTDP-4-dehydrorhamnose reductase
LQALVLVMIPLLSCVVYVSSFYVFDGEQQ